MSDRLVWRQLHWSRPLDANAAAAAIRAWAADQASPQIVLETRADAGRVRYLLATPPTGLNAATHRLTGALPGLQLTDLTDERQRIAAAARLKLSTRHRPLRADAAELITQQVHTALAAARDDEVLVLQVVLGARRIPLAVPNNSPSSVVMPWYQVAWMGNGGQVDGEKRAALRNKVSDHGFAATLRLGVRAAAPRRRQELLINLYSALRVGEAPGLQARLTTEVARRLNDATSPWLPPLRLNVTEVLALTGWPVGDAELPGQPPLHPKQIPPTFLAATGDRVIGDAWAPDVIGQIGLSIADSRRGMWIIGPNGTGKWLIRNEGVVGA
jgi:hypothetical protein